MKISHGSRITDINTTNGYGYATKNMIDSLHRLGHEINPNDLDAPVEIWFDQPHHWDFKSPYKIGYHPWESTRLKDGWVDIMNTCDEIWTPSPLIAEWYKQDGVKPPVYVYEHGVDKVWTPKTRQVDEGVIKFLHCGGEAARKRADRTMEAFRRAFPDRDDVTLTLKMINPGFNLPIKGKISILNQRLDLDELITLFHDHHVYVYPSHGEGFGLTPLQAMATGMPTITVPAWAPYKEFMDPNLSLSSKLVNSPWSQTHPGKMYRPSFDDLIDQMRYVADNYEQAQAFAHSQIDGIRAKYDWDTLTKDVFDDLEERL